jgi:hypothetical protein
MQQVHHLYLLSISEVVGNTLVAYDDACSCGISTQFQKTIPFKFWLSFLVFFISWISL